MGDLVRAYGDALRATSALTSAQHEVLGALARCRTAALGGHLAVCDACGHSTPVYNSCRNRHCPTCQSLDQHRWLEARRERILPTRYFHVVFTLPEALRAVVRYNRTALFGMLFAAASETLLTLARDPRRLGALPAITMVLHTWTRELLFHPHIHAVVSAGGLSLDRTRWVPSRSDYLFPVKVLAGALPRKVARGADRGTRLGRRDPPPPTASRTSSTDSAQLSAAIGWSTPKRPSAAPNRSTPTIGRYAHRVGISNARIQTMDERGVTFATKGGGQCTLPGVDFLRRFVDHVLPKGFTRIRHYGLLAPCHATITLEQARALLTPPTPAPTRAHTSTEPTTPPTRIDTLLEVTGFDVGRC